MDIEGVLAALSLEEKANLLSGQGAWETSGVERLGVRPAVLTDGPHGVRLQDPASTSFVLSASLPATCFPTAAALGSSWDVDLLAQVGAALGTESRAAGVNVLLGPGVNIKRSPLCGRNFEYLSEDPLLTGHLGAALVNGLQSQGVGASVKHFAANNQETDRMHVSAEVDERTLRELYLAAFEHIVREARPWTLMAAYNRINGVPAAQNSWLLTEVLRQEWGFDGVVMSDWGAVTDPVEAVAAGLDLEMPSTGDLSPAKLIEAVKTGQIDETMIDRSVLRLLRLLEQAGSSRSRPLPVVDFAAHHDLARRAAVESTVLLKNKDAILPLDPADRTSLAVIGEFARTPTFQGGGSSLINATRTDSALEAVINAVGEHRSVSFSAGFALSGEPNPSLCQAAVDAAAKADVALVFLGLPEGEDTEGVDRTDIDLPDVQLRVLRAVAEVNDNVVVVLANGSVVEVASWEQHAKAVLEGWLNGQAGGSAIADLLFGRANPSGRLAETVPLRLQDTPAYLNFPGNDGTVVYGERFYVGYRYYDAKDMPVAYPFGHGLSYTTFVYSNLRAVVEGEGQDVVVRVRCTVTNAGSRIGKEVVQVYVGDPDARIDRPTRELKAFTKIELAPGQSESVEFELRARDLSFFSPAHSRWVMESGDFEIGVGASSRDLRLTAIVTVQAPPLERPLDLGSTVGEWLADPTAGPLLRAALNSGEGSSIGTSPEMLEMIGGIPLDRLVVMSGGRLDIGAILQLIEHDSALTA